MPWPLFDIVLALPVYVLVLFRISGLVLTAPVFSSAVIPVRFRVGLAAVVAAMMFPMVKGQAPAELSLGGALVGAVGEMTIGVGMGLSLAILLSGGEVAGLIVGRQASIALSSVFDPVRGQQTSIVGQIYTITFTTLFLLSGGHRAAMAALLDTYDAIPLLAFSYGENLAVLLVEMLAASFVLGIRLATPVLISLFLLGTSLAFLSRTMPQLNILTVGFTLRILVGLGVAALALQVSQDILLDSIWDGVALVRTAFSLDPLRTRLVN